MMNTRTVYRLLPGLCVLALLLRLAAVWLHPVTNLPDAREYDSLAKAVLHGGPYALTDAWGQRVLASRMPGYPAFVAAIYACAGAYPEAVLIAQALLGALGVLLAFMLGRGVSSSFGTDSPRTVPWPGGTPGKAEFVGLAAALLVALDPLGVLFSAALLSETVFTVVLLALVLLSIRIARNRSSRALLAIAVLAAVAVYLRASCLWLVIALPVLALRSQPRRAAVVLLTIVATVVLALAPWQIRNHGMLGTGWLRLTTLEGISLYEAVYPEATGGPMQDKIALPPEFATLDEAQRDAEWSRRAWECMRQDPARIAGLALVKIGRTWNPGLNAVEYRTPLVNGLLMLWHIPIYALALVGLWGTFRGRGAPGAIGGVPPGKPGAIFTVALPIVYFSLVHGVFQGSVRYRVPLMPLVYILAAVGLARLAAIFFNKDTPTNSTASV